MADEVQAGAALLFACLTALAATPLAIRLARRTAFYDRPQRYKAHLVPTPYLGGAAVLAAVAAAVVVFAEGLGRFGPILIGAAGLWVVGTIDDRRNLRPVYRLTATVAAAALLWSTGSGWSVFELETANLAATVVWVVALVNAFNLMDNIDGAMSTVGCASGAGIAAVAIFESDFALAGLALSLSGACVGFLKFNLASPARIFLGDGGSMSVGFLVAAGVMALPIAEGPAWQALVVGTLLVGLPAFDTALVILARYRRGVTIWAGGRDHLTHRLLARIGSQRTVALIVGVGQAALGGLALATYALGDTATAIVGILGIGMSGVMLAILESDRLSAPVRRPQHAHAEALPARTRPRHPPVLDR
jgi:UDP-GlcNAc:undecaprenyl-phosphate/decaprenyl-phosphate GlcNAc-1-phosphate transferase